MARQMTLIDFRLFSKVPLTEFTRKRFTKEETSPHLTAISEHFNRITRWIGSSCSILETLTRFDRDS